LISKASYFCLSPFHRILESENDLGWKGPYRSSSSHPSAMGSDPFHQPRLLPAPSNLALNPAREGAATASLDNLGQGFTTLRVRNFFLMSNLNPPLFQLKAITPCPVTPCPCQNPLSSSLAASSGTGRLLSGVPGPSFSPG